MFKDYFFLKINLMSEQMGTLCWKTEIIFKNPMEILELTNIIPVLGCRKRSINWNIGWQKQFKMKHRKKRKNELEFQWPLEQ